MIRLFAVCGLLLTFLPTQVHAGLASAYQVTGLGTLPGDTSSIAYGINEAGVIVGSSSDAGGSSTIAGFKWQAGVMTDLGLYTGHTAVRPWDVNASGNVTGRATGGPGGSNYGIYHDGSGWQLAGQVGGTRGNGFGINDANEMVGNMRLPSGDFSRAYVWTPTGGTIQLPTVHPDDPGNSVPAYGGFEGGSYATGINASGVVVGSSGISDTHGSDRGFRWTSSGGMTNLGTPASQGLPGLSNFTQSYAQNLSDSGLIVGAADRGSGLTRAVYWDTSDVIHDIGTLGGSSGWAYAVNDDNLIVGFSSNGAGNRAFGFVPGGSITDLNTLLAPSSSGWLITRAYDINGSGMIVGEGTFGGVTQGVLLTPVPEPSTLVLFAVTGLLSLRFIPRKGLLPVAAAMLACGTLSNPASAEVTNYRLFKEAYYSQTGPNTVSLSTWAMDANIQASADYATSVVLTPPTPGVPLNDSVVDGFWEIFFNYPDRTSLDAAYPDGTYEYALSGGTGGSQTASLTMPVDFIPKDVPQFNASTYTGIRAADPAQDFLVSWNSFTPDSRALNPRVRFGLHNLTVEDFPIFEGNLSPTTTQLLIPGGTLVPGHEYELLLIFSNANRGPNAGFGTGNSLADANRQVTFEFVAVPEPASLSLLAGAGMLALRRRK